ncbi:cytochrome c oxidase accessory protein FixG [Pseudooceanicola antarcticus]|uniref:Cytochrome c oxidase accessory protein CcoG n=1 Tax=Pseudooceanicola antarcticus TaxID=1247613 RepID=A0A285I0S4_9RHOB|nr:cytochrome c oxidase accessory protein CcoG [Pseudooceanicola antarcticus]PJE30267.1 cytochrome c oxidase accessory protein CcoG [Pseudooceanicola antarcticus]SNY41549.1 cytochrome c oxidase accessory protein FixG [Pseudooceanicola antarcticus]
MSASDTEDPKLYAPREPIFPRRVKGRFRNLKWVIMIVTLGIYYVTPWLRWDRGPNLPDQAVLIDLANRRFFFFWIEIWPHEFYFIAGLLVMAGLGLFLFTSALGRVWCGYACPQTVWTDLFILVERWIEGDRNARLRLHRQKKWDLRKLRLRVTKWVAWFFIGLATGGAWVFYFADAPSLLRDLVTLSAHPVAYTTMLILTFTTFLFGGFAREQICIYACPWPRIQAAMMDEDTITVAYRDWRGEPRGKHRKAEGADKLGDCIDCNACVNVCPMGIDIRDGQQMACITCALCIDACDDVMDKVGKPRGLIDYMALTDEVNERAGKAPRKIWKHVFRPRTILYTALWAAVGIGLVVALFIRSDIDITVAPVRNPTYITLSDGTIRNVYDVRLRNKHGEAREFRVSATDATALEVQVEGSEDALVEVAPDATHLARVYVTAPAGSAPASTDRTEFTLWVEDLENGDRASEGTVFNGKAD